MNTNGRILVADDEQIIREVLSDILSSESYDVDHAENGAQALELIRNRDYGAVLLDLMLPDRDGLQVLEEIKELENRPEVIIITAYASIEKAIRATKLGAFDFFEKPFKNDKLLLAIKNALEHRRLLEENRRLLKTLHDRYSFHNIIGKSAGMQQVFDLISQAAPRLSTILIQGESGTGKELVAKAIHASSGRSDAPFIAINCGNIPSELLESELFGHVRGAFTGATDTKRGLFEAANGGTLFLDELTTISLEIQSKLLRVIQEREFRRLGGLDNIKVDVRIIAASNADLQEALQRGTFREDLYYRLNVISIQIPPLRNRPEDIPLLTDWFIKKYGDENQRDNLVIGPSAMKALMDYQWPGNVRELENVIERAVVLSPGNAITADLFPNNISAPSPETAFLLSEEPISLKEKVGNYEKALILAALKKTGWNQKKAARILSVNATTLNEKLKRLKIKEQ
ncbi:MAG: sigma-54-dependent Fis family transcriptional regulator [Acidobacteria bacterium]|nr:sigma-54-dependent Fis family transcriptional regulator [Acidobacteriota bacterium]